MALSAPTASRRAVAAPCRPQAPRSWSAAATHRSGRQPGTRVTTAAGDARPAAPAPPGPTSHMSRVIIMGSPWRPMAWRSHACTPLWRRLRSGPPRHRRDHHLSSSSAAASKRRIFGKLGASRRTAYRLSTFSYRASFGWSTQGGTVRRSRAARLEWSLMAGCAMAARFAPAGQPDQTPQLAQHASGRVSESFQAQLAKSPSCSRAAPIGPYAFTANEGWSTAGASRKASHWASALALILTSLHPGEPPAADNCGSRHRAVSRAAAAVGCWLRCRSAD